VQSIREHGMAGVVADLEAAGPLPDWLRSVILTADPAAVAACYAGMLDWPGSWGSWSASRCRPLCSLADRTPAWSTCVPPPIGFPGARLAELLGCGHLDTFTRSHLTLPLVLPFLTETLIETPPSDFELRTRQTLQQIAALTLVHDLRLAQRSGACSPRLPGVASGGTAGRQQRRRYRLRLPDDPRDGRPGPGRISTVAHDRRVGALSRNDNVRPHHQVAGTSTCGAV
jgi:hypothetical protein